MLCDEYMTQYHFSLNDHAIIKWSCSEMKKKRRIKFKREKYITEVWFTIMTKVNDFDSNTKLMNNLHSNTKLMNNFHSNTKLMNNFNSNTKLMNNFDSNTKLMNNFDSNTKLMNNLNSNTKLMNDFDSKTKLNCSRLKKIIVIR